MSGVSFEVYEKRVLDLKAEIVKLRAALEPFASLIVPSDTDPDEIQHFALPASYFFAARKALKDTKA